MVDADKKLSLSPRVRHRMIGSQGVLVHMEQGRVMVINEVGMRIVEIMQDSSGPVTLKQLTTEITQEYDVGESQVSKDVMLFIEQMSQERALVVS